MAHRKGRVGNAGELRTAAAFLLPALFALFLFRLLPAGYAVLESFKHRGAFVGFENYLFMFRTPGFLNSMKVTLLFNLIINPVQIVIALALALLFTRNIFLGSFWRVMVFTPVAIPLAISSMIWGVAFRPDDGILNALLTAAGFNAQPFLTSPDQALLSIIILATWVGVGFWMLFLVAGLGEIPQSYYDAAKVDGAGWWRILFQITLPMLRRVLAFVLVADTVSNFRLFAPVHILTNGGPQESTNLLLFEIYRQAYTFGDIALAFSEVVLLIVIMLSIVMVQFRLLHVEE